MFPGEALGGGRSEWASESHHLYKYTLGSHSEALMCLCLFVCVCVCVYVCLFICVCVCLRDATATRQARGYYWPAGLPWRPVVSERSNICGVFVCQDRFSCLSLCFSPSLSVFLVGRQRHRLAKSNAKWSFRSWCRVTSRSSVIVFTHQ